MNHFSCCKINILIKGSSYMQYAMPRERSPLGHGSLSIYFLVRHKGLPFVANRRHSWSCSDFGAKDCIVSNKKLGLAYTIIKNATNCDCINWWYCSICYCISRHRIQEKFLQKRVYVLLHNLCIEILVKAVLLVYCSNSNMKYTLTNINR